MKFDLFEYGDFVVDESRVPHKEEWGYGDKWLFVGTYIFGGWEFYPAALEVWVGEGEDPLTDEWLQWSVYPADGCTKRKIVEEANEDVLKRTTFESVPQAGE